MKIFEAIRTMTKEEIAAILYLQYQPFFEAFKVSQKKRDELKQSIYTMLETEVKDQKGCVYCENHKPLTPLQAEDVNRNKVEIIHASFCHHCGRFLHENFPKGREGK